MSRILDPLREDSRLAEEVNGLPSREPGDVSEKFQTASVDCGDSRQYSRGSCVGLWQWHFIRERAPKEVSGAISRSAAVVAASRPARVWVSSCLFVALAVSVPAKAELSEPAPESLTLAHAIERALAGNPDLEATRIRGRQIQAMYEETKAPFLPFVTGSYSWNRGDWPHIIIAQTIDARAFPENAYLNTPGTFTVYEAIFEARMNLWSGGRNQARRSLMATAVEICGTEQDMARNALVGQVIESYFDVLAAEERLRSARQLVETTRARLTEQSQQTANGASLEADLAEVQARLAEAEAGVVQVESSRGRGAAMLAVALGMPAGTDLQIRDEGPPGWATPDEFEDGLGQAVATRPELSRARLMSKRFDLGVKMAKADFLPRLDTYWSVGSYRNGNPLLKISSDQKVWYANMVLSYDIFDGGARKARLAKARAELDEFRAVDRKTTLAVELDVKQAYLRSSESRARLAAAESRLKAAEAMAAVRRAQHDAGAATVADALEAEQMLTDARMGRINASFELRKAAANQARSLGLFVSAGGPLAACCTPVKP